MTSDATSKIVICRGAIATERRLLAEIERRLPRTAEALDPPVRVIVPSRSLRLHLLRRLVEENGAAAGVAVQTLGGAAREIIERSGGASGPRQAGFELVVRRLARGETVLSAELDGLDDGYGAVLGAVRDLVDAGFGPGLEDGVLEQIDELGRAVPRSDRERAAALVRVAARALEAAELTGAHPRAASYRLSADAVAAEGRGALPSRALLVHGFADLTGVAADLLTELLRACGGIVVLDRVPDPAVAHADDAGNAFLGRLEIRLGGLAKGIDPGGQATAEVRLAEAPDIEAEARWVAEAVRDEIDGGARPESIGVVTRRTGTVALPFRRQFGRLGVPFSGIATGVPGGRARRKARRLADLLRRGGEAELDLWVEVIDGLADDVALLLGLRVLSLTRLRDLAELRPDHPKLVRGVPLPLDPGVVRVSDSAPSEGGTPRLDSSRAAPAIEAARALLDLLEGWPASAPAADHFERTGRVLETLGWQCDEGHGAEVLGQVAALALEVPQTLTLESEEWISELVRRLDGFGEVPIGGRGGGVQLLSVTEARGRTFDLLFVCGLNRGVFPRQVVDDALLPDAVRARLAGVVLPEMPVKARSADEERYLFAQLLSSAPRVDLSWHLSAGGKRAAPSPFVERLRASDPGVSTESVRSVWSGVAPSDRPRPVYEHSVRAAGEGSLSAELLAMAVEEGRSRADSKESPITPGRLAAARVDVLDALEKGAAPPSAGPWFGFVGSATTPGDKVWVTHLEAVASCPWRAFVERRLGVRPLPDPHLGLPDPDHRLVGNVVHEVLERIVSPAGTKRFALDEALSADPVRVPWPSDQDLDRLVADAAEAVVYREGLGGFGLARLLEARARPILAVAREIEWDGGCAIEGVLAAETEGELIVDTIGRTIGFRADRLDTGPRATDYKSGKPLSDKKLASTRERHLMAKVKTGHVLQAVAYALAAPGGVGRYLYLKPDIGDAPDEARIFEARGDDPDLVTAFSDAVGVIVNSLATGAAVPMVDEPKGKNANPCLYCEVEEACRRGDSAVRRQLNELMNGDRRGESAELAAARDLWWLGIEREETR